MIDKHNPPSVALVMGSQSDWETMKFSEKTLRDLEIPVVTKIISAHRTPERMFDFAKNAEGQGFNVIIAGAGGAAHLPGMISSHTHIPVIGVPIESSALKGMDSLLSIVQMPAGVPVATMSIGKAGAINAAIYAAKILSVYNINVNASLKSWLAKQTNEVPITPNIEND
ncbi:5-(carboxyamino)imidazole ribonucleotide mutase [Alphaproteobacteria bacterium]|jgi:5-(carboxyamino)imidazole ribonucleotide mutase|nr:5-(carboxyamino)imidazole ribonucleotide mutase [Alphaproteobacteria bacterium]MDA9165853.1 5-(carboxyamino)imidazole ribonucleotide mutase [Alphaproteobacteria bacterium]MDA9806370.1 5-(carboxyamino)imidazole ribonucleotide mutase [Alphaproteobacteria bacterium]MDB2583112.1 5-(carboxyamino)imidazole ribonucleotide mutase [Alphaproteobacteria bacterium]MDC6452138.1 5-(carboxyamino)imidazole ribonucleotide mutase [Alphaproteobacteria bacterium]